MSEPKESRTGYQFLPETCIADRLYSFFHDARLQTNIVTSATYESTAGGAPGLLTRPLLEPALRQMLRDCPRLSTSMIRCRDTKKGRWERRAVQLDSVDLDACLVFLDDPGLTVEDVANMDALRIFPSEPATPHWRVVVLQGRHVLLCFNHIGFDGMSTLAFHRRLLRLINEGEKEEKQKEKDKDMEEKDEEKEDKKDEEKKDKKEERKEVKKEDAKKDTPSEDNPRLSHGLAAFQRDPSWPRLAADIARELARGIWADWKYSGRRLVLHNAPHGRYERRTGGEVDEPDAAKAAALTPRPPCTSVRLPAATMGRLMAACRQEGREPSSFTGVLHAAVMAVLAGNLYPEAVFGRSRVAVSYRRFTGSDDDAITDEVGHVYWGHRVRQKQKKQKKQKKQQKKKTPQRGAPLGDDPLDDPLTLSALWAAAAQYTRHVRDDLAQAGQHARAHGYQRLMGRTDGYIGRAVGLMGAQRHRTVEMSNLGVFVPTETRLSSSSSSDKAEEPSWAITDVSFRVSTAHHSVGGTLALGVVSLKGGDCVINVCYDRQVFSDRQAGLFRQKLEETLLRMAEGEGVRHECKSV